MASLHVSDTMVCHSFAKVVGSVCMSMCVYVCDVCTFVLIAWFLGTSCSRKNFFPRQPWAAGPAKCTMSTSFAPLLDIRSYQPAPPGMGMSLWEVRS